MSNKIWNVTVAVDLTNVISLVLEYLHPQIFFFLFEQELSFLCCWGFGVDIRVILTPGLECYQLHAVLGLWQDFVRISRPPREGRQTPLSSDGIPSNPPVGLLLCFRSLLTFILCCTYITLRHNYTDHCTERTRRKVGLVKHLIAMAPVRVVLQHFGVHTLSVMLVRSFRHIDA